MSQKKFGFRKKVVNCKSEINNFKCKIGIKMVQILFARQYTSAWKNTNNEQNFKLHGKNFFWYVQSTPVIAPSRHPNYHTCHAGMRNRKMTRNVCITLGHMFPSRVEESPRDPVLFVRLSFPKIREVVAGNLHLRRGRSICFSLTVQTSTRSVY